MYRKYHYLTTPELFQLCYDKLSVSPVIDELVHRLAESDAELNAIKALLSTGKPSLVLADLRTDERLTSMLGVADDDDSTLAHLKIVLSALPSYVTQVRGQDEPPPPTKCPVCEATL